MIAFDIPDNISCLIQISLSLMELRTAQEVSVQVQRPIMFAPLSPCFGVTPVINRDKASPCKFNLRKVKSLTDFVSSRKLKKAYHGEGTCDSKFSTGIEDSESPLTQTHLVIPMRVSQRKVKRILMFKSHAVMAL